jgi:hypothetical protein
MLLYRIQDKETRKFWGGVRWYDQKNIWSDKGAFFHNVEPIERWLMYLAGAAIIKKGGERITYVYVTPRGYKRRLQKYRVVVADVTVKGSKKINAEDFIK